MIRHPQFLNGLLAVSAALFLVSFWNPAGSRALESSDVRARTAGGGTEEGLSGGRNLRPGLPRVAPSADGARLVAEYTEQLSGVIEASGDPVTDRTRQLIAESLPPGWENTFVLHDAMVVSAALTDIARLTSFASSRGLAEEPRKALSGESLEFQSLVEDFSMRWLGAKYPGLGEGALREIVLANNQKVLPLIGAYNLLRDSAPVEALGIPVAPAEAPVEFVLPEGIRRIRELQNGTPPRP
jgi:hypothetical protein